MAGGADTDLDIVPGRTRLVGSTAGADDGGFVIFGMKTCFHRADQYASRHPGRQIKLRVFVTGKHIQCPVDFLHRIVKMRAETQPETMITGLAQGGCNASLF